MPYTPYKITEKIHISNIYSFFEPFYENGYTFSGETHNFWECLYVLKGSTCVSGDERVYNLSEGEIIFHKPLELHKFYVDNPSGASLLIFSFSAEGELCEFLKDKVFKLSPIQKDTILSMLHYARSRAKELNISEKTQNFNHYVSLFDHLPYYSQMIATYIYQLVLSLADNPSLATVSSAPDSIIFSNAVNYMNNNIMENPSVYDIARSCNVSEAGLKRIFDKYAGIGVHKYFLKLKFKAASEYLMCGTPVSVVAEMLGFSSQAYFTKSFKRETGMLPSESKRSV